MNSSKQIKLGALISYFAIAFNIVAGLIYTPWMISKIGQSNYGLYTLATSVISMFVMDFGMGAAVTRFLSRYNAMGDKKAVNDFLGLIYKLYLAIDAVIFAVLICVYFFVDKIYANLTPDELSALFQDFHHFIIQILGYDNALLFQSLLRINPKFVGVSRLCSFNV